MKKLYKVIGFIMSLILVSVAAGCQQKGAEKENEGITINFYVDDEKYDVITVLNIENITMPIQPQNNNYDFAGWFLDEGKWDIKFEPNLIENENEINVYAAWKLKTPNLSWGDNYNIVWDTIIGASSYVVELNDVEYKTSATEISIPKYIESEYNTFRVKAISNNPQLLDSEYSYSFSCNGVAEKLEAPTGLKIENNILSWDAVDNATGYRLHTSNFNRNVGNILQYSLTDIFDNYGTYEIEIMAIGDGRSFSNSDMSKINFTISKPSGTGTEEDPYILYNYLDFINFIIPPDVNNSTLNKYYELGNDINLGGKEIKGNSTNRFVRNVFQGCFDGNGYTISNFKIVTQINEQFYGLFGGTNEGIIRNVNLRNFSISPSQAKNYMWIGSIVGRNEGHIINCHAEGKIDIKNSLSETTLYVGGIAGSIETGGLLTNSGFSGSISVFTSCATVTPFVGGVVGKGAIKNCYVRGEVSLECNIGESYVNANSLGVPCRVGGLVGDGAATECYAEIDVKGEYTTLYDKAQNSLYVGGLIGTGNVLNSYSVGTVTLDSKLQSIFSKNRSGSGYAGGLVGAGNIRKSYSLSDVIVVENPDDEVTTPDGVTVGMFGYKNIGGLSGNPATVEDSIALGNIFGNLNIVRFGRIVGYSWKATIDNSYYYEKQLMCGHLASENLDKWSLPISMECCSTDLNSKEFYTDTLGWDESIWDFSHLDVENGMLPRLKSVK